MGAQTKINERDILSNIGCLHVFLGGAFQGDVSRMFGRGNSVMSICDKALCDLTNTS